MTFKIPIYFPPFSSHFPDELVLTWHGEMP